MNTIHTWMPRFAVASAEARVSEFNARMAKKGLPGRVSFSADLTRPRKERIDEFEEITTYPATLTATGEFRFGEWRVVGMYEWPDGHQHEALRWGFPDGFDHDARLPSPVCDHCEARRWRKKVFVLERDGAQMQVGSTCVKDYTGHNPTQVLRWWNDFRELGDELPRLPRTAVLTLDFVALATAATREFGYQRTSDRFPTNDRVWRTIKGKAGRHALQTTDADYASALAAMRWAIETPYADDFYTNLRTMAGMASVTPKRSGVLAYLPTAYARHLEREEEKRDREREAPAKRPTPEGPGPHTVTGTVVKVQSRYNSYNNCNEWKATVRSDAGYTVWGSIPSKVELPEKGDRVRFTVSDICRSNRDDAFGFYKRPRAWESV